MPVPSRPPARLRIEPLEDRLTPDAVLVTMHGPMLDGQRAAALSRSPAAAGVERVADGLFRVELAAGFTADTAGLAGLNAIAAVQPDTVLTPAAAVTPNDPGYSGMWQYPATDAPAAWGVSTGTGATVVAVIDTGVDVTHPDLAANIWRNPREVPGNGRDDDGNGYADDVTGWNFQGNSPNVADDAGHGTHAAGIVGAVGNNGQGVAGVNWRAKIMPLKFMSAAGGFTSDAVRAIDYAVANGAKVINESWGGGPYNPALAAATQRARAAGVIVVAAAGNSAADTDRTPFYPAGYAAQADNVVAVAAGGRDDRLAGFSNFGRTGVTLAAPGVNVNSTLPGGRYGLKSGTSMAAPFVAGAVSLVWDANPTWTYSQVLAKLRASVDTLPALTGKVATGGRLDLGKLLDAAPAPAPPPAVPPPPASPPPAAGGARVAAAVIGGPRAGVVDRAWVRFTAPVDATAVRASTTLTTPAGAAVPSAVLPVAGSGGTQFTLVFARRYTAAGGYTLAVGTPAAAERYVQTLALGQATAAADAPAAVRPADAGATGATPAAPARPASTRADLPARRADPLVLPPPRSVVSPVDVAGWLVPRLQTRLGRPGLV